MGKKVIHRDAVDPAKFFYDWQTEDEDKDLSITRTSLFDSKTTVKVILSRVFFDSFS